MPELAISITDILVLLGTGVIAGFLSGLFGIGGGVVLVPGLLYVFSSLGYGDQTMHMAVGTSLAIMIPTGFSSARAHWKKGSFNKQAFLNWAPGIVVGVAVGTYLASLMEGDDLKAVFAVAICFLAVLMQFDPKKLKNLWRKVDKQDSQLPSDALPSGDDAPKMTLNPPSMTVLSACGIFVGGLSSLMGIGGATMTVPTMTLLGMHIRESVATASAIGVMISIPAAVGFALIGQNALPVDANAIYIVGYIHFLAVAIILPVSVLMTRVGVMTAHALPFKNLKQIFSLFMVFLALRMLWSIFG